MKNKANQTKKNKIKLLNKFFFNQDDSKGQLRLRLRIDNVTSQYVNFHANLNLMIFFCCKLCCIYTIYVCRYQVVQIQTKYNKIN